MTHVAPLPLAAIDDPELKALIARAAALGVPDDLFPRLIAHAPAQAKPLLNALLVSHAEGGVDHKLKEVIRIQLSRFAGDRYFASLRSHRARDMGMTEAHVEAGCNDYEDSPLFNDAEKAALRYSDQMYLDPRKVDGEMYADLKRHWTEPQIMELGAFIAFHYGMQVFMRTLGAGPAQPRATR